MLIKCRECKQKKNLTELSLETRLCEECRTCLICEEEITNGTVYYTMDENYRSQSIRCISHLGKQDKYRQSHHYDLEKLLEEYKGEKESYLSLQQENKELKNKVEKLEDKIKELETQIKNLQPIAQIQINSYQKQNH